MDATERFAAAVAGPAAEMRLDVAAFCLAAHAHPTIDVDEPQFDQRPHVGLRPTTPQNAAGMRIEPPMSVPTPSTD